MIVREFYKQREDEIKLFRTYSDNGVMIQKEGTAELYIEAIDIEETHFSYIETLEKIPEELLIEIVTSSNNELELTNDEIATMLEEVM